MPEVSEKAGENKGKWLKIELSASPLLVDALSNFLIDIGAQGVYQEELESQAAGDFGAASAKEVIKAYLPFDIRLEHRIDSLKTYLGQSYLFISGDRRTGLCHGNGSGSKLGRGMEKIFQTSPGQQKHRH